MIFHNRLLPLLLLPALLFGGTADSLKKLLPSARGEERVDLLISLSRHYTDREPDSSLVFAKMAKDYHVKQDNPEKDYRVFFTLALAYDYLSKLDSALLWYEKAHAAAAREGNSKDQAGVLSNIGIVYKNRSQMELAIRNQMKARNIYEELQDTVGVIRTTVNIATVYSNLWDMANAVVYYTQALELSKKINLEIGVLIASSGLGVVELRRKNTEAAYEYLSAFYKKAKEMKSNTFILNAALNLGDCHILMNEPETALIYLNEAGRIAQKMEDWESLINIDAGKALCYAKLGDFTKGEGLMMRALEQSKNSKDRMLKKTVLEHIVNFYLMKNDAKAAMRYFDRFTMISDSLSIIAGSEAVKLLLSNYELEKKEREIADLKNKEQKLEIQRQQLIILLVSILLATGIGIIIYLFNQNKRKLRYAKELETEIELRKQAEMQTLIDTNNKLQLIMKFAKLGYCEVEERERVVTSADLLFTNIFGVHPLPQKRLTFNEIALYFSKESRYVFRDYVEKYFADPQRMQGKQYDIPFTSSGGRDFFASFLVLPDSESTPGNLHMRVLIQDITERKTNEEYIASANKRLTELNAVKDRFFSIIAHDLKSPFHGLIGITQLISTELSPKLTQEEAELVNYLHSISKNTFELLENLLEWSRTQTGGITYTPETILLDELVKKVISVQSGQAKSKGVRLTADYESGIFVYADRYMLTAVLRNLLSNAIKFSYPGTEVSISYTTEGTNAVVCVADQGVGIPDEISTKLFRIEEKISTPGTNDEPGTGLGLALAHEFIVKNGGDIRVESKLNEGSRFYFSLPLSKGQ